MIKNFNKFLNENKNFMYKLYLEDDTLFEDWDIIINFSNLWEKYSNGNINIETFIKKYKLRINEYKEQIISKKGNKVWNELVIILNNLKKYENVIMYKKLNEVYDWADKNNIKIKT